MKLSSKATQLRNAFVKQLAKEIAANKLRDAVVEANEAIEDEVYHQLTTTGKAKVNAKHLNLAIETGCEFVSDCFDFEPIAFDLEAAVFQKLEKDLRSKMKVVYETRNYKVMPGRVVQKFEIKRTK